MPAVPPGDDGDLAAECLCQSAYSSQRIASACDQPVDFLAVTAPRKPGFRTASGLDAVQITPANSVPAPVVADVTPHEILLPAASVELTVTGSGSVTTPTRP